MAQDDNTKPVISSVVRRFLVNRLSEVFGLLLFIIGAGLLVAFVTATDTDPSFNTATGEDVQNLLGVAGAITADLFFKSFGLVAFLVPVSLLSWSMRFFTHTGLPSWYWRMPMLFFAVALTSGPEYGTRLLLDAPQGGIAGLYVNKGALSLIGFFNLPDWAAGKAQLIVTCLLVLVALPFYLWVTAVSQRDWGVARGATKIVMAPPRYLWLGITALFGRGAAARKAKKEAARQAGATQILADQDGDKPRAKEKKKKEKKAKKQTIRTEPVLVPGADVSLAGNEAASSAKGKTGNTKTGKTNQTSFDFESSSGFRLPSHNLLKPPSKASEGPGDAVLQENATALEEVLGDFGVNGEIKDVAYGPVVTRYGLNPAAGTKSQRVIALADDIARSMSALSVRVAVVPGHNIIGIEMPNKSRDTVLLRDIMDDPVWTENTDALPICLGKDIAGAPVVTDLAKMPHLLVAGTTGSGKSVGINAMILSLLYRHTPETCRLIMIDPKMLELSVYDGIPHLLSPVVTDPSKAVTSLKWAVREMETRYFNMSKLGVRNITGYNERLREAREAGEVLTRRVQTGFDAETGKPVFEEQILDLAPLPFIVVIIDEVADLMLVAGKDIEAAVQRLAQMARAAGIHVIMATQRPSVDVITGTIKANFPTRISFSVTSKIDSRTILGEQGAEQLLGRGDMLFLENGGRIKRVHGPFMEDREVEKVADFLRAQGEPEYDDRVTAEAEDDATAAGAGGAPQPTGESLYDQAVALVVREQKASTSFVQRHLKIGYNRAATIIEEMESAGIISKANHVGKREVLLQNDQE